MSDLLRKGLEEQNIPVTEEQLAQFQKYMELVLANNEKVILTAIKDPEEFYVKHFLDSVAIYNKEAYQKAKKIIDVGTGGGFPGVPLAILSPEKSFVLMDSLRKRMDLVREMCAECGIQNVEAIHARAEDLDTRGLTSITAYSNDVGWSANWQLQPPSTPSASMMLREAERSI